MDKNSQKQGTQPQQKKQKTQTQQGAASEHEVMTDKHKDIFVKCYETLISNITAGSILSNLVSASVISMPELETLNAEKVEHTRAGLLLGMLLKKEDSAFDKLIKALDKYNMPHLAKLLKTADEAEEDDNEEEEIDIKEDVKEEIMDEREEEEGDNIVVVAYNGDKFGVDVEEDGTLLVSTVSSQLAPGHTAKGLYYTANGLRRAVRMREGKFFPPKKGWGTRVYNVLPGGDGQNKSTVEPSPAGNPTEANKGKDETEENSPAAGQSSAAENGEFTPMSEEHVRILNDKRTILTNSMDPVVMNHLRSLGVLTLREEEDIKHGKAPCAQIEALLNKLQKEDDSVFGKLVNALRKTQPFLAKLLIMKPK